MSPGQELLLRALKGKPQPAKQSKAGKVFPEGRAFGKNRGESSKELCRHGGQGGAFSIGGEGSALGPQGAQEPSDFLQVCGDDRVP